MLRIPERNKLINAIVFFAMHTRYLGAIKLFKLLYLLGFEHLRSTGRVSRALTTAFGSSARCRPGSIRSGTSRKLTWRPPPRFALNK
jgi:hypothetical protein